jgi:hypothetical protein
MFALYVLVLTWASVALLVAFVVREFDEWRG